MAKVYGTNLPDILDGLFDGVTDDVRQGASSFSPAACRDRHHGEHRHEQPRDHPHGTHVSPPGDQLAGPGPLPSTSRGRRGGVGEGQVG